MTWTLYQWTWKVASPLFIGSTPAGSLNRCRLFVPVRPLWGALTAELARQEAAENFPRYDDVGKLLRKDMRFTYLYPAELENGKWSVWLPLYKINAGLVWTKSETDKDDPISNRAFRRRLVYTRPGTSIDPVTDAAEQGSLRETECIQTMWRDYNGEEAGQMAMIGYIMFRENCDLKKRLEPITTLFLGGDTCYGLGRFECIEFKLVSDHQIFGKEIDLESSNPCINSNQLLAHTYSTLEKNNLCGNREYLRGWDRNVQKSVMDKPLWIPGSFYSCKGDREISKWYLTSDGVWSDKESNKS